LLNETTKTETTTEWFVHRLATSAFPIQMIRTLGKAIGILTGTAQRLKTELSEVIFQQKAQT
jgi:hypothetical protein